MKPRILIVEDDTIIAAELADRLQDLGYEVCGKTGTAENAVILAEGRRPDLVLMDIRLKAEMDGVEAAAHIRANFDIPVVYLTAYADDDTLERAKVTEPYGYVIKPFEERELYTAIEMGLHKHKLEKQLRESKQWLEATLRSIGDGVVAADKTGRITFINRVAETLLGCEAESVTGLEVDRVLTLVAGEGHIPVSEPVGGVLALGQPLDLAEHWLAGQGGQDLPIEGIITPIRDHRGQIQGSVVVFRDTSDRKREEKEKERLQARLYEAQKSDALAAMAGSLVHRFNNLMTAIIGSASLILVDAPAHDQSLRSAAERIKWAGQAATSLLCQVLPQGDRQVMRPQPIDLDTALARMTEGLDYLAGKRIEVSWCPGTDDQLVHADPAHIEEVVTHLATNAVEAMPEGGVLTLATDIVSLADRDCHDRPQARPGTFVRLSVSDTGIGMDEETLDHIFEPFFTTKAKSAGLGLPTVSSLLRQNQGWIDIISAPGRGTTGHVYLPIFSPQETAQPPDHSAPSAPRIRPARILLVEDDEEVQAAVAGMLEGQGITVVRAGSAQAALESFEAAEANFDLLLSDVVLPDKDGLDLADYCLSQQPDLGVLLTSGYTDQRACRTLVGERGYQFLQKPFDLQDLLAAIEQALARPARSQ